MMRSLAQAEREVEAGTAAANVAGIAAFCVAIGEGARKNNCRL